MTTFFIIITVIISALAFQNHTLYSKLIFNPYTINSQKQWYRFFSSGFIHADVIHLIINMLVLYSFGGIVEYFYSDAFGERAGLYFIILYVSSIMISLIPTYNSHKLNPSYNGLGEIGRAHV